jgi:molecular chaperone DnaK
MPQVEVTFDIDANGILHVSAKDRATGKEQKIRIEASSGLSDAEIERMVTDAEAHAGEDEERREKVESRNQLDSLIYQVDKDTGEWGEMVTEGTKERLDGAVEQAKEALKGDDLGTLNSARDELMQAFSAAGQEMYQSQAAEAETASEAGDGEAESEDTEAGGDEDGGSEAAADDDVVEADYEIVDEEA